MSRDTEHSQHSIAASYTQFLEELKKNIRSVQTKAALSLNRELLAMYLDIGRRILEQQEQEGWGISVIERLSRDLRREFPEMKGFSPRNLWDMRRLYGEIKNQPNLRQLVAEIPWGHNLLLLNSVKDPLEREWYVREAIRHGWSRKSLSLQIKSDLYHRQGKAVNNFERTLPPPQSDLAQEALKDPYIFDFLTMTGEVHERDMEKQLVRHITRFLLELGAGFAFVGEQYHLEVAGKDYYLDLLFYHIRLHCYLAIELKVGDFKPEYVGKINFYLSALDDLVKLAEDNPSIGLILCATKDKVLAEYALRDIEKPIGVAEWQTSLTRSLPKDLKSSLPTIEEIEAELETLETIEETIDSSGEQGRAEEISNVGKTQ